MKTDPVFVSPLDDVLDDFRLAFEDLPHEARIHLINGLSKLVAHVRHLEGRVDDVDVRVADLEK